MADPGRDDRAVLALRGPRLDLSLPAPLPAGAVSVKPAPLRTYLLAWVALISLLLVTLASAYMPLGAFNSAVNLAFAAAKAILVAWFFMHWRIASAASRIAAIVAL